MLRVQLCTYLWLCDAGGRPVLAPEQGGMVVSGHCAQSRCDAGPGHSDNIVIIVDTVLCPTPWSVTSASERMWSCVVTSGQWSQHGHENTMCTTVPVQPEQPVIPGQLSMSPLTVRPVTYIFTFLSLHAVVGASKVTAACWYVSVIYQQLMPPLIMTCVTIELITVNIKWSPPSWNGQDTNPNKVSSFASKKTNTCHKNTADVQKFKPTIFSITIISKDKISSLNKFGCIWIFDSSCIGDNQRAWHFVRSK